MPDEEKAEDRLRELLRDPRWSLPAWRDPEQRVRRAARRQRLRVTGMAAGVAAAAVIAVAIPVGIGASGHPPRPAGRHQPPAGPAVYVAYAIAHGMTATFPAVIPISTATNRAGKPINVGDGPFLVGQLAITPDGRTVYAVKGGTVIPISTATNRPGKPIYVGRPRRGFNAAFIAITPDGKTAYVANDISRSGGLSGTSVVIPISTATNTPGQPIHLPGDGGLGPDEIAITPDGKTAYVVSDNQPGTITPISTATNTPGQPISVGGVHPFRIAVTPDGKTAYVLSSTKGIFSKNSRAEVTPVSTATNTPGKAISLPALGGYGFIAITPDGKTAYVTTMNPRTVIPISTATNTAGKPIKISDGPVNPIGSEIAITPDGKTAYALSGANTVIPISTATNTPGPPILFASDCRYQLIASPELSIAITPDGKTAYVACEGSVVQISTATNTPGKPIRIALGYPEAIAITP